MQRCRSHLLCLGTDKRRWSTIEVHTAIQQHTLLRLFSDASLTIAKAFSADKCCCFIKRCPWCVCVCVCVYKCVSQTEAKKGNTSVFRRNLLTRLQQEFMEREQTRTRSISEWVCVVMLLCNIFDYLKVNNTPISALVDPVYDCLFRLAQPDALMNEEEVDCLALQLHRVGEQLEKQNARRMEELFCLLRDGFLLQDGLRSMSRLLLLEVLEFRAGGWVLSASARRYYYSELVD
ncbi:MIF4G domain-containing protein A isoform X2 [Brachyhypopomus gauderio]|uniref:MIF4G domain-containing protein A isoform X2 n=1 Tax=Brachyhypopomus gauderio TaxID=698409 RepID=UPI0040410E4B